MELIGRLLEEKYRITGKIGEGSMSEVFRGLNEQADNEVIAVKVLKRRHTSSHVEDVIRFHNEVGIISKLDFPAIIKIQSVGEIEDLHYLVTEYIEGTGLDQELSSGEPPAVEQAVSLLTQISLALDYVHQANVIHRDLKPGNILLTNDKQDVKLIDFGLAQVQELSEIKDRDIIAGTFSYMSPEHTGAIKRPVDERSDLYSLGILGYQMLTGRLPFRSREINTLIHQHIAKIAEPPSRFNPRIPEVLEKIILKLMEKDPEKRYQSAQGLLSDLRRVRAGEQITTLGVDDKVVKLNFKTSLVGREEELEAVQEQWHRARQGQKRLCLIGGEAGRGKTRLAYELRQEVIADGHTYLEGKFFDRENKIPFGPFKEALDHYAKRFSQLPEARQDKIRAQVRSAVGDLGKIVLDFNALMEPILGECQELVALDQEQERRRFSMVLRRFFQALGCAEDALVILLDDLQWVDAGSFLLLQDIINAPEQSYLLIMGTYRDNEVGPDHPVQALLQKPQDIKIIPMDLFDQGRMDQFIARLLHETAASVHELSAFILKKSQGNPFFSIEILKRLVELKVVHYQQGHWHSDSPGLEQVEVPTTIVAMVLKRIELLDEAEINLLAHAAVIGKRFDIEVLFTLIDLPQEEIVRMVDKAIDLQLLEFDQQEKSKLLFVHERIKDAFYMKIPREHQIRIHGNIIRALEQQPDYRKRRLADLAYHAINAHQDEKIVAYAFPMGKELEEGYGYPEALQHFGSVIEVLEKKMAQDESRHRPQWLDCQEHIGQIYLVIGKNPEAITLYQKLLPYYHNPLDKAKAYQQISQAYFKMADFKSCEAVAYEGMLLLNEKLPLTKAAVTFSILKELAMHVVHNWFSSWFIRQEENPDCEKDKLIVWFYYSVAWSHALTDISKMLCSSIRVTNVAEQRIGPSRELSMVWGCYGNLFMATAQFPRAFHYYEKAVAMKKAWHDEWGLGQLHQFMALCRDWQGNYRQAMVHAKESARIYQKIGDLRELGTTLRAAFYIALHLGDLEEAWRTVARYTPIFHESHDSYGISVSLLHQSHAAEYEGNFRQAYRLLKQCDRYSRDNQIWFINFECHYHLASLCVEMGAIGKAVAYAEKARELERKGNFLKNFVVSFFPIQAEAHMADFKIKEKALDKKARSRALKQVRQSCRLGLSKTRLWRTSRPAALRVMASYYDMTGHAKEAEKYFAGALKLAESIELKFEIGRINYEYGYFLQRRDRGQEALPHLETAGKVFQEMNAVYWLGKTRRLLPSSGREAETAVHRLAEKRRLYSIIQVSQDISTLLDVHTLLERIMSSAMELTGAQRGYLMLSQKGRESLEIKVSRNIGTEEAQADAFSQHIVEKAFRTGEAVLTTNAMIDDNYNMFNSIVDQGLKSIICLPLRYQNNVIGVCYLDNALSQVVFAEEDKDILNVFMTQAAISIENARLYEASKTQARLKQEMEIAERIQTALIPSLPVHDDLELEAVMRPAEEVGGDYYDITTDQQQRLWLAIGDVSGHGVTPGLIMMMAQSALSTKLQDEGITPLDVMDGVNRTLYDNVSNRLRQHYFMTMNVLCYCGEGVFQCAGAGHVELLVYRREQQRCEKIRLGGVFLGILPKIKEKLHLSQLELGPGDLLVLYTDGIVEAMPPEKEGEDFYGLDRFQNLIIKHGDEPLERLKASILEDVLSWTRQQPADDITFILARKKA